MVSLDGQRAADTPQVRFLGIVSPAWRHIRLLVVFSVYNFNLKPSTLQMHVIFIETGLMRIIP